jgi:hypothetical protein
MVKLKLINEKKLRNAAKKVTSVTNSLSRKLKRK